MTFPETNLGFKNTMTKAPNWIFLLFIVEFSGNSQWKHKRGNEDHCVGSWNWILLLLLDFFSRFFFLFKSQYTFQYVFDEYTSQKALFDHVGLPLVEDVLRGKNGTYVFQIF